MTEIRTRDEALVAIDHGLAQWASAAAGALAQAGAAADRTRSAAESKVRQLASRVTSLVEIRNSLGPDGNPRPIEQEISVARLAHQAASQAARQIADVARQLTILQRSQVSALDTRISSARADLTRRAGELGSYRSAGGSEGPTIAAPSSGGESSWLARMGMTEIDVAAADFSDDPIVGRFGRGGTTLADYRWAVQTWDEVVRPGVARGMTRDDFDARDAERNPPPLRRTASVYDMFLGDQDRLRLSRHADGRLTVDNGRHRLQVAQDLGVPTLPAEVT